MSSASDTSGKVEGQGDTEIGASVLVMNVDKVFSLSAANDCLSDNLSIDRFEANAVSKIQSKSDAYHSADALADAHYHATQALQHAPRDSNTLFNLSIHYWHLGENRLAVQMLERVLGLDRNNGFAAFLAQVFPYTCAAAPDSVLEAAQNFDGQLKTDMAN